MSDPDSTTPPTYLAAVQKFDTTVRAVAPSLSEATHYIAKSLALLHKAHLSPVQALDTVTQLTNAATHSMEAFIAAFHAFGGTVVLPMSPAPAGQLREVVPLWQEGYLDLTHAEILLAELSDHPDYPAAVQAYTQAFTQRAHDIVSKAVKAVFDESGFPQSSPMLNLDHNDVVSEVTTFLEEGLLSGRLSWCPVRPGTLVVHVQPQHAPSFSVFDDGSGGWLDWVQGSINYHTGFYTVAVGTAGKKNPVTLRAAYRFDPADAASHSTEPVIAQALVNYDLDPLEITPDERRALETLAKPATVEAHFPVAGPYQQRLRHAIAAGRPIHFNGAQVWPPLVGSASGEDLETGTTPAGLVSGVVVHDVDLSALPTPVAQGGPAATGPVPTSGSTPLADVHHVDGTLLGKAPVNGPVAGTQVEYVTDGINVVLRSVDAETGDLTQTILESGEAFALLAALEQKDSALFLPFSGGNVLGKPPLAPAHFAAFTEGLDADDATMMQQMCVNHAAKVPPWTTRKELDKAWADMLAHMQKTVLPEQWGAENATLLDATAVGLGFTDHADFKAFRTKLKQAEFAKAYGVPLPAPALDWSKASAEAVSESNAVKLSETAPTAEVPAPSSEIEPANALEAGPAATCWHTGCQDPPVVWIVHPIGKRVSMCQFHDTQTQYGADVTVTPIGDPAQVSLSVLYAPRATPREDTVELFRRTPGLIMHFASKRRTSVELQAMLPVPHYILQTLTPYRVQGTACVAVTLSAVNAPVTKTLALTQANAQLCADCAVGDSVQVPVPSPPAVIETQAAPPTAPQAEAGIQMTVETPPHGPTRVVLTQDLPTGGVRKCSVVGAEADTLLDQLSNLSLHGHDTAYVETVQTLMDDKSFETQAAPPYAMVPAPGSKVADVVAAFYATVQIPNLAEAHKDVSAPEMKAQKQPADTIEIAKTLKAKGSKKGKRPDA